MLDRINKAYSAQMRFVSDASHELRTPIAVIQGYAALLDRWGKDDPEALAGVHQRHPLRGHSPWRTWWSSCCSLARGDNDTQPVKRTHFDLTVLAGEVLREEEMIHEDRLFLPRWREEPVPVYADQGLIKQVDADFDGQQREIQCSGQPHLSTGDGAGRPRPGHRPGRGHGHLPRRHPPHLRPFLPHRPVPGPKDRRHRPGAVHCQVDRRPARRLGSRWSPGRGWAPGSPSCCLPIKHPRRRRRRGNVLRLSPPLWDGTLYAGFTNDLARRLAAHNAGKGAKYTRGRRPVELVYWESFLQQIFCPPQGSTPSSGSPGGRSSP